MIGLKNEPENRQNEPENEAGHVVENKESSKKRTGNGPKPDRNSPNLFFP